jgi:Trk-type K+ transport system membrane component
MRLDVALNKLGVKIVTQQSAKGAATLMLRVPPTAMATWAEAIEQFLLAADALPKGTEAWTTDVSRSYFVDQESKSVRYLWRVILRGNPQLGAETLGMAIIRVMSQSVEVTSQPLVGRVSPAPGSTKGAHAIGAGPAILAQHFKS